MGKRTSNGRARVFYHELQVFKRVCREIDTPRALAAWLLVSAGEIEQYLNLEIQEKHYVSPHQFADDYLVTELLRKSPNLPVRVNREAVAFSKWVDAEETCKATNERLSAYKTGSISIPDELTHIILLAKEIVAGTLGRLSVRTLENVYDGADFGPGATLSVGGRFTRGTKYQNPELTTTQALLPFGIFFLPPIWRKEVHGFKVVDYNRMAFVPKNAKTDRTITIEADLNIYVQKGIGRVLRQRLANQGVDLDHGQEVNRSLARKAWRDGLSTIDLSSASDTIAWETVALLLPEDWLELLDWARPAATLLPDGTLRHLEKFSGMGNGYTFELETLIFWALLSAVKRIIGCKKPIAVFGDDMVCSNDVHLHVLPALEFLGFSVNKEKTYGNGPFHESCGEDYFYDTNVRPFHLKWKDYTYVEGCLYLYGNLIRRYANRRNFGDSCDSRFLPAWLYCRQAVEPSRRFGVPAWDHLDGGFVCNFDESGASRKRDFGGYSYRYNNRETIKSSAWERGSYISSLRTPGDFSKGREPVRGSLARSKTRVGLVCNWPNLGPWI